MSIDAKMWSAEAGKKFYKKIKKRIWHSHFTPLPGRPWGADFYTFWRVGSYGWRNHPCQILSRLVKELGGYGSPKSGVSHWLLMSLLQQCYALTCYTVISDLLNSISSCFRYYCALSVLGSRVWPFWVMWRHRNLIKRIIFQCINNQATNWQKRW